MRTSIWQFCPTIYPHILNQDKIVYRGNVLKTSYLIDLMHTFIVRKYIHKKKEMNLWSVILRKKYGTYYNLYVDWLLDHRIIELKKKWKSGAGGKSKLYRLTLDVQNNVTRYLNRDKFLLKKINNFEKLETQKLSPIYQMMVDDLKHITLQYDKALESLNNELEYAMISNDSYFKNKISIDAIRDSSLYYCKDEYGRLHTNYTNLKKSVRNNFLTINGEEIVGLDIKNCQPKLLAKLMLEREKVLSKEQECFIQSVRDNTFYDSFKHLDISKDDVKKIVFQIFFGKNIREKNNIAFNTVWPGIWHWIVRLKREKKDHRYLSHLLQSMESDLIYNKICYEIKQQDPSIVMFTVHDGLYFAKKHLHIVQPIFDKYESQII